MEICVPKLSSSLEEKNPFLLRVCAEAAEREPETSPLGLLLGNLQPLLAPDALNPLVVDLPALPFQKGCNAAVAVTTVLTSQPDLKTKS